MSINLSAEDKEKLFKEVLLDEDSRYWKSEDETVLFVLGSDVDLFQQIFYLEESGYSRFSSGYVDSDVAEEGFATFLLKQSVANPSFSCIPFGTLDEFKEKGLRIIERNSYTMKVFSSKVQTMVDFVSFVQNLGWKLEKGISAISGEFEPIVFADFSYPR